MRNIRDYEVNLCRIIPGVFLVYVQEAGASTQNKNCHVNCQECIKEDKTKSVKGLILNSCF